MELFSAEIWQSLGLTIELASLTTLVLLIVGTPLAWWLARSKSLWAKAVGTIIALPLVLPPTVLGLYLLFMLGPNGPGGFLASIWGWRTLAFTFAGLVVGSVLCAVPFVVQPIRNAFATMGNRPLEVAATLRASPLYAFFTVALPLARPGLLTAAVLGVAHTTGAFGLVLMIGGNVPGRTKVLPAFLFDYVQASRWREASSLGGGMVMFAFAAILTLTLIEKYSARRST
ncbi:molybdenum ABC transporter permease [Bradyrhizobium jicamae]|uniref:Molybdenum transport system permease n=1 Tax=Bradyrhizobium jicamae TaxID=280332 RepID=A0A0R3LSS8_9BRAD|nr:molybdate ABC transporter permease subunit [Bradyrhizobium jicamae]KRR07920.1 molybdenum ABC transporter permease [Bradyrhizobium jicamae]